MKSLCFFKLSLIHLVILKKCLASLTLKTVCAIVITSCLLSLSSKVDTHLEHYHLNLRFNQKFTGINIGIGRQNHQEMQTSALVPKLFKTYGSICMTFYDFAVAVYLTK